MKHLLSQVIRRIGLLLLFASTLAMAAPTQDVQGFVHSQMERYPQSRLLDLYKSCFQDYMGAEHLVADTAGVMRYLRAELASVSLADLLPHYYEPCGIGGRYVRVSLRAVLEGLISIDKLADAFIRSANSPRPSVEDRCERWHNIVEISDAMHLGLSHYADDRQLIDSVLVSGRYALSHSSDYREAYHPHYRIVERSIFERELLPLLQP